MGYDGEDGRVFSFPGNVPRATLVAQVARELDCDFTALTAVVRYARPMSRQEVWDDAGREAWLDEWKLDNGVGFYFDTNDYRYDGILANGEPAPCDVAVPSSALKKAELPDVRHPPDDWELPQRCAMIQYVDDPNGTYPTEVERVLVVEA